MEQLRRILRRRRRRLVGLMSGTSADGVDAALVEVVAGEPLQVRTVAFCALPMPPELRRSVLELCGPEGRVQDACLANVALGEVFAEVALAVIRQAGLSPAEVDLIGSHGQTVRHLPRGTPPSTLQLGEAAVIAARTGIVTVADFRPADVAVGGQGAPLVPLVDHLLFTHPERDRVVLNIGGIANVTVLPAGCPQERVTAFDLGPGNALVDAAVTRLSRGAETCDRDGRRGLRGKVDEALLSRLMEHEFLRRRPPKSTGREEFGAELVEGLLDPEVPAAAQRAGTRSERWRRVPAGDDLVATLTAFTARAIAFGLRAFVLEDTPAPEMWVGGGGVHNPCLMGMLRRELPGMRVESMAGLGVDPDAREAVTFAVLAHQTLCGRPGNLPSATGARRPAVLGKIALP
ncbi:MAG: anhydro-N-acetylmuramic acid kinase [Candidatus Latescibacterota bacterium]